MHFAATHLRSFGSNARAVMSEKNESWRVYWTAWSNGQNITQTRYGCQTGTAPISAMAIRRCIARDLGVPIEVPEIYASGDTPINEATVLMETTSHLNVWVPTQVTPAPTPIQDTSFPSTGPEEPSQTIETRSEKRKRRSVHNPWHETTSKMKRFTYTDDMVHELSAFIDLLNNEREAESD